MQTNTYTYEYTHVHAKIYVNIISIQLIPSLLTPQSCRISNMYHIQRNIYAHSHKYIQTCMWIVCMWIHVHAFIYVSVINMQQHAASSPFSFTQIHTNMYVNTYTCICQRHHYAATCSTFSFLLTTQSRQICNMHNIQRNIFTTTHKHVQIRMFICTYVHAYMSMSWICGNPSLRSRCSHTESPSRIWTKIYACVATNNACRNK